MKSANGSVASEQGKEILSYVRSKPTSNHHEVRPLLGLVDKLAVKVKRDAGAESPELAEDRGVAVGSSSYKLASVGLPSRTFSSLVLLRLKTTSTKTFLHL